MEAGVKERPGPKAVPDPDSDAEAIERSGGKPADPPAEPEADLEGEGKDEQAVPELEVEGDGQLTLKIGGDKPTKAEMKLRGGSIGIPKGQYEKGDVVNLLVKVRCTEVHLVDKVDGQTGDVTEVVRRHVFKVSGCERVGS